MSQARRTWRSVVTAWRDQPAARRALSARLLSADAEAVYWETSPSLTGSEPFRDAVLPAQALFHITPDREPFASKLLAPVVSIDNLGGDSRLIIPNGPPQSAHLLAFLRSASPEQTERLILALAEEVLAWWADPDRGVLWLSTHGTGVPWLHVRLDPRPKYYRSALRTLSL